jgi:murein DD-endopeptidase MepM/ murein hydrolase activator NlpD
LSRGTLTVIFLPDGAGRPRTVAIKRSRLRFAGIAALVSLAVVAMMVVSYGGLRRQVAELNSLQAEAASQRAHIASMAKDLEAFQEQFQKLQDLDLKLRLLVSMEPSSQMTKPLAGLGGPDPSSSSDNAFISDRQSTLLENMRRELGRLKEAASIQEASFNEINKAFQQQRSRLAATPSIWPVKGWRTSGFGQRISPFTGRRVLHTGIDIATRKGAIVRAPADGLVNRVTTEYDFGKLVEIDHGHGVVTRYGHNNKILVRPGQRVRRGEPISQVGNSGRSTGPHLHYEVRLKGVPVNPKRYIVDEDTL